MSGKIDVDRGFLAVNNSFPAGMLLASLIIIVAASILCIDQNGCRGRGVAFAVAAGCVMFILTLIYMWMVNKEIIGDGLDFVFCIIFFLAWTGIAGFTTFVDPFENLDPANGFLEIGRAHV